MATYANQKCTEMGATVVAMSDSNGYVVDENGIDFRIIQQIKEQKRERISTYPNYVPTAKYVEGCASIWSVPCDIAMPCATQNEIDTDSAKLLVSNGCKAVFEGSNMPCTPEAIQAIKASGLLYSPSKASNAGGVAVSGLEMSQNSERLYWTFEAVDAKLKEIMENIYRQCADTAAKYGQEGDIQARRQYRQLPEGGRRHAVAGRVLTASSELLSEASPGQKLSRGRISLWKKPGRVRARRRKPTQAAGAGRLSKKRPAKGLGGKDTVKENRQGCLSHAIKPLFRTLKRSEKCSQLVENALSTS